VFQARYSLAFRLGMAMRRVKNWLIHHPIRYAKKRASGNEVARYVKKGGLLRLNIGAQQNWPAGWLNVDILPGLHGVYLDATVMAAVPTDTFDAVLCEHMIEHVPALEGQAVMRSIYRILKPGGVARFVTPKLERLARTIIDPQEDVEREIYLFRHEFNNDAVGTKYPELTRLDYVNIMFREWGHQYLYTREDLADKLMAVGFSTIVDTKPNEVANKIFENAQGHGKLLGYELNDLNAFALEVTK
jgi:predicted SAM-dependent methyltransferase